MEIQPQFLDVVDTSARDLRSALSAFQEGVFGAGDLKVTAAAAGRSVDVAAGVAVIQGDSVADQGPYRVRNDASKNSDTFETGGIAANASGNPRIDSIIAHVYDQDHDNSGLRKWRLEVAPGTPQPGGTSLDSRNGAPGGPGGPAIPPSALVLADVLVPTGATSIVAGNIRDRRPWARGAYRRIVRNAGDYTTALTAPAAIDPTNLSPRIECSGAPLRVSLRGAFSHSIANSRIRTSLRIDGAAPDSHSLALGAPAGIGDPTGLFPKWDALPAPGSHLIAPYWRVDSGTGTIRASAAEPLQLVIEEISRQDAENT